MKTCLSLLLSILVLMGAFNAFAADSSNVQWGPATNDFLMSIELKDGVADVTNGQPCVLTIRFKNISKTGEIGVLQLLHREADLTYSFTVLDPFGKDISPNPNGPFGGSAIVMVVGPGEIKGVEFNLSAICNFGSVGKYKVIAKKQALSSVGKPFQVVSNPLPVKVVPNNVGL